MEQSPRQCQSLYQRLLVYNHYRQGKSPKQTTDELCSIYGQSFVTINRVTELFQFYSDDCFNFATICALNYQPPVHRSRAKLSTTLIEQVNQNGLQSSDDDEVEEIASKPTSRSSSSKSPKKTVRFLHEEVKDSDLINYHHAHPEVSQFEFAKHFKLTASELANRAKNLRIAFPKKVFLRGRWTAPVEIPNTKNGSSDVAVAYKGKGRPTKEQLMTTIQKPNLPVPHASNLRLSLKGKLNNIDNNINPISSSTKCVSTRSKTSVTEDRKSPKSPMQVTSFKSKGRPGKLLLVKSQKSRNLSQTKSTTPELNAARLKANLRNKMGLST